MTIEYETIALASKRLGIAPRTLRKYCADGDVPNIIIVKSEKQLIYAIPISLTVDKIKKPTMGRPKKSKP